MEEAKKEFEVDHLTIPTGTSFSQLLLADDDVVVDHHQNQNAFVDSFTVDQTYNNNNNNNNLNLSTTLFSFHNNSPKMLCFSNYENELMFSQTPPPLHKSIITSSTDCDSSSVSSCNQTNTPFNSLTKSNSLQKKRNGSGQEPGTMEGVVGGKQQQRASKKTKAENPTSSGGHAKKKEKLGERIAALQQLVSPFGKTDTASVLHEATGYIRFLHDQVQVLCSPYLQSPHIQFQPHPTTGGGGDNNYNNGEEVMKDLRSRGLCLIPIGCTLHVASSNGADFWSPAATTTAMEIGNNVLPSGSVKQ